MNKISSTYFPIEFLAGNKRWYYLGHAHIFERADGEELIFYDDGDIDCSDPNSVSETEFQECKKFMKENLTEADGTKNS